MSVPTRREEGRSAPGALEEGERRALADRLLALHAELAAEPELDGQLTRIMELLREVLDAERATLYLHDARAGELYARVALGAGSREIRILQTEGIAGDVFTQDRPAIVHDAASDPRFEPRFDELTGYTTRSVIAAPLHAPGGARIGVAQGLNKRDGRFDERDLAGLEMVAQQAAIVLRNALFVREARRAGQQESRFLDLVSEVSTEIQLGPLLQKIMVAVTRMLDAERSTLFLNDEKAGELYTEIGQGLGATKIRLPNDQGIAGAVFSSGASINIPHAYADLRFNPSFDQRTGFFTRSILCVPVTNKDGKRIGVTQVLNKRGGTFSEDDEARLRAFTAQISIGLENAQLFDDVQAMKRYNDRVLASMSNGVLTFDEEGALVTCNEAGARILRRQGEALAGRDAAEVFGRENGWVLERIAQALEADAAELAVDAALHIGEETVSVNLTALPLEGAAGEATGSMVLLEDISREKRVRATMARYVDEAVADRLLGDEAEALGGRAGVASVMFSDVRSFTPLAETLGAQATVALLNDYFTRMVACIEDEGGMLDKFVGDEIMAVFGVPFAREDDADRALRAAIEMMRRLRSMNAERAAAGAPALEVGVGIHTGDVFSGNIGSPRRMDFTVMGDGVNLASRIEGLTKKYAAELLISEDTLRALRATYRTREVDRVVVKGRSRPVAVHEVLDYHDEASFPNLLDTLTAYREGVDFYRQRRFEDAISRFERALGFHPEDRLSAVYAERCRTLLASPPPEDWDGVWVMKTK